MAIRSKVFDREKALNSLLYLCQVLPRPVDVYTALKVIYFADKLHLSRFGRLMFGESYFAMENGPVPSGSYDLVKYVGGRLQFDLRFPEAAEALYSTSTELVAKQAPDLDALSRSEIGCLQDAAGKYGTKSFAELKRLSHDDAFKKADPNGEMSLADIALMLDDGMTVIDHLRDRAPGDAKVA